MKNFETSSRLQIKPKWKKDDNLGHKISGRFDFRKEVSATLTNHAIGWIIEKCKLYLCKTQFFDATPSCKCLSLIVHSMLVVLTVQQHWIAVFSFKLPQFFDSSSCRGTHYYVFVMQFVTPKVLVYQPNPFLIIGW